MFILEFAYDLILIASSFKHIHDFHITLQYQIQKVYLVYFCLGCTIEFSDVFAKIHILENLLDLFFRTCKNL